MGPGLLGMGPIPKPYTMADYLLGRPFPSPPPPVTYDAIDRLIDGIDHLTKSNYDHALAVFTASKKRKGGRRAKEATERALVLIGRWVEANGEPKEGEAARIVDYVLDEVDGVERSTIFDLVRRYARAAKACKGPPSPE